MVDIAFQEEMENKEITDDQPEKSFDEFKKSQSIPTRWSGIKQSCPTRWQSLYVMVSSFMGKRGKYQLVHSGFVKF